MVFSSTNQPAHHRLIPWATVEAIRRDWSEANAAAGIAPEEVWPARANRFWLRDRGQPSITDLARRHGLHPAKVYEILKGRIYRDPPEVVKARREQGRRAWLRSRQEHLGDSGQA